MPRSVGAMTPTVQITVDAADPHALADFWAAALGYDVEDNEDFIRQLIDDGIAPADAAMERNGKLVWTDAAACRHPDGTGPRLYVQRVPEPKSAKNRFHLDLHVGEGERDAAVARLVEHGATELYVGTQGPNSWVTMADPEGNEFCVA